MTVSSLPTVDTRYPHDVQHNFEYLFNHLLESARSQAQQSGVRHKFCFKNKLLPIDATTIELCASVFDWA
jgi:hypothetical protein